MTHCEKHGISLFHWIWALTFNQPPYELRYSPGVMFLRFALNKPSSHCFVSMIWQSPERDILWAYTEMLDSTSLPSQPTLFAKMFWELLSVQPKLHLTLPWIWGVYLSIWLTWHCWGTEMFVPGNFDVCCLASSYSLPDFCLSRLNWLVSIPFCLVNSWSTWPAFPEMSPFLFWPNILLHPTVSSLFDCL